MTAMNEDNFSVWTIVKDLCFLTFGLLFCCLRGSRRSSRSRACHPDDLIINHRFLSHRRRGKETGTKVRLVIIDYRFRGQLFFMKILIQRRPNADFETISFIVLHIFLKRLTERIPNARLNNLS